MAVLLTEWVFEGDLVSKMAVLLTEWAFEGDLVSKMAVLLTDKGVRRARCDFMPHNMNTLNVPEGRSNPSGSKSRRAKKRSEGTGSRGGQTFSAGQRTPSAAL